MGLMDFNVDGLLEKLAQSPAVANAMAQFTETRNGIVQAMTHFNERFTKLESIATATSSEVTTINAKTDRIIFLLENPSSVAPAAEHKIENVLQGQQINPCPVVGCDIPTIHDHDDGNGPVFATPKFEPDSQGREFPKPVMR